MSRMETNSTITADQLTDLRDTQQLSWVKVADALGLGSPGAARRTYSELVRPHTESMLTRRNNAAVQPVDLAGADLEGVRAAIAGRTVTVTRKHGTEAIHVAKVTSVKNGTINFFDGDKSRAVKAAAIVAAQ